MKKIFLYAALALATFGIASCNEDFEDWADPQAYPQEDPTGELAAVISAVPTATVSYDELDGADVNLIQIEGITGLADVESATITSLLLDGTTEVPFTQDGDIAIVTAEDLAAAVKDHYQSMSDAERELTFTAKVAAVDGEGQAYALTSNDVTVTYKATALPDQAHESAYYYVGGYNGWNLSNPTPMEANGDGTYSCTIEIGDGEWYKFASQSTVDAGDWDTVIGCETNGSTATSDFLVVGGGAMQVETGGKYKFTLDPVNWRYTVTAIASAIYAPGNGNGWDPSSAPALTSPNNDGTYTGFAYLDGDFKFTLERNWNSEYNYTNFTSFPEGWTQGDGTNIKCPTAGYYYLSVTAGGAIEATLIESISVIGDFNSWSGDAELTYNASDESWSGEVNIEGGGGWKFRMNHDWSINLGGESYDVLEANGANLSAGDDVYTITLYPSRRTSDNIYCTVEEIPAYQ